MSACKAADTVMYLVAIVATIALICLLLWIAVDVSNNGDAIDACKEAAEEDLVAPASAEWGDFEATTLSDNTVEVVGQVDAENKFGAMLRNKVRCVLTDDAVTEHYVYED